MKAVGVVQSIVMLAATTDRHKSAFPLIPELADADCVFSYILRLGDVERPAGAPEDLKGQLQLGYALLESAILRIHEACDKDTGTALFFNILANYARASLAEVLKAYNAGDVHELRMLADFVYLMGGNGLRIPRAQSNLQDSSDADRGKVVAPITRTTPTTEAGEQGSRLMQDCTYLMEYLADEIVELGEECRAIGDHRLWGLLNCYGRRIGELNSMLMSHFDNDGICMGEAHGTLYGKATAFNLNEEGIRP